MFFKTALGLEISGKDLRIAVVRSAMGRLRFMRSFEINGFADLTSEEQGAAIGNLIKQQKLPSSRVHLSLPRNNGIVRQIEFPVEVQDSLKSAVSLQIETLCPWPVQDIYWDFSYEAPKKKSKNITVTIVIIPRATLDPWIEFFKSVGLPLSGASLSSISCAHGIRALWADEKATLILDCEEGYVEGCVVQASHLASVTQAGDNMETAIKGVAERLLSLGRVNSPEDARFIMYGNSASMLEPFDRVALPIENAKIEDSDRFGAIAAALNGLKKTAFHSNLIPRDMRYRQNQMQLIPTYVLLVLGILLGIALAVRGPYQSMVYASMLEAEIQKIAPDVREASVQEAELNKLSEKYRTLAADFAQRDNNLEVLREFSRSLPPTAWITNYAYQDGIVTISGFATSASEVQKVLEDSNLFKDVQFTSSVTRDNGGKDRFTLKASIEVTK